MLGLSSDRRLGRIYGQNILVVKGKTALGYYDDEKNVRHYIRIASGYDGKLLLDALRQYLPAGSTVLELGMGPGKDLLMLNEYYGASGSDASSLFVERFRRLYPSIDVKVLDAITMGTDERFDGIYSNKVLYHLTRDELLVSFERQAQALNSGGIALHSFWHGDGESDHQGLHFAYYSEEKLNRLIGSAYEILDCKRYTEAETDDSFYVVLRKR